MYDIIEPEYKLLFLLMADMGLRREEALSARAEDVDEYHETMSVVGKGNKERILPWASDRFVDELKKVLDKRPAGHLTINPKTGERFVQIRKALNRAAQNAGLNRDVNPHLLRHSCLTNLAKKGMSPHALQQFAGHSSIETTNAIYVHIRSDFVGDEMRRIRKGG
jgi:integrase